MSLPPNFDLRPARPADAPAMAEAFTAAIEAKARASYGPGERAAWTAQGTAERFAAMLADPAKRLFVAEAKGVVVGLAGLEGAEVILLYAAPAAPPGTGAALLDAVEAAARQNGQEALTLTSSRNALPFYLRHGFAVISLASRPLPGGVSLPVCLMLKSLDAASPRLVE